MTPAKSSLRTGTYFSLVTLITSIVAAVYQILGIIGIVPPISQDLIIQLVGIFANILVTLGIWVDPTTDGVSDSEVTLKKTDISETAADVLNKEAA